MYRLKKLHYSPTLTRRLVKLAKTVINNFLFRSNFFLKFAMQIQVHVDNATGHTSTYITTATTTSFNIKNRWQNATLYMYNG